MQNHGKKSSPSSSNIALIRSRSTAHLVDLVVIHAIQRQVALVRHSDEEDVINLVLPPPMRRTMTTTTKKMTVRRIPTCTPASASRGGDQVFVHKFETVIFADALLCNSSSDVEASNRKTENARWSIPCGSVDENVCVAIVDVDAALTRTLLSTSFARTATLPMKQS
jgi:hypothetical protein